LVGCGETNGGGGSGGTGGSGGGDYEACGPGSGGDNPQPEHISGSAGDTRIEVTAVDDAADFDNLQWAVDNVARGGTVKLCAGTFFLGEGSSKRTLMITRGITIEGVKSKDGFETVIRGGGGSFADLPSSESGGALHVANTNDENPNVFRGLWLRDWTSEAIFISASAGFTLRDSRISHPITTQSGGTLFIHAIWSTGEAAKGDFTVENNIVEFDDYAYGLPHDEQLMGIFFSNHSNIRIVGNLVNGHDEAFEIIRNGYPTGGGDPYPDAMSRPAAEIVIENNVLDLTQTLPGTWAYNEALLIAANANTSEVRIEDNVITVRGTRMGHAVTVSGEGFQVRNNSINLEQYEGVSSAGAIMIGLGFTFGLVGTTLGGSLTDSVFENNIFTGSASGPAIFFNDPGDEPNESHGNVIDVGDSLIPLDADIGLEIAAGVHDNTFIGDFGTVTDHSMGANDFQ
jgi:hypothetical protein